MVRVIFKTDDGKEHNLYYGRPASQYTCDFYSITTRTEEGLLFGSNTDMQGFALQQIFRDQELHKSILNEYELTVLALEHHLQVGIWPIAMRSGATPQRWIEPTDFSHPLIGEINGVLQQNDCPIQVQNAFQGLRDLLVRHHNPVVTYDIKHTFSKEGLAEILGQVASQTVSFMSPSGFYSNLALLIGITTYKNLLKKYQQMESNDRLEIVVKGNDAYIGILSDEPTDLKHTECELRSFSVPR